MIQERQRGVRSRSPFLVMVRISDLLLNLGDTVED